MGFERHVIRCVGKRGGGEAKEILGGGKKEAISWKMDAYKAMCQNSTEENKRRHKSMQQKAKKAVSKAMRRKAEEALSELQNYPYGMFRLVQ